MVRSGKGVWCGLDVGELEELQISSLKFHKKIQRQEQADLPAKDHGTRKEQRVGVP
jgi:hypothetical protein